MTRAREAMLRLFASATIVRPRSSRSRQSSLATSPRIVRNAEDGERELVNLNWGFVLLQKGLAPRRVTNVRDDRSHQQVLAAVFEQRRCLVPSSSGRLSPSTRRECVVGIIASTAGWNSRFFRNSPPLRSFMDASFAPATAYSTRGPAMSVDWTSIFYPSLGLAEVVVRGSIMYLALFAILRFVGRRQSGHFGPADLLVIVLIADAAQNALGKDYQSVTEGVLLVLTIVAWEYALDWAAWKFPWPAPAPQGALATDR